MSRYFIPVKWPSNCYVGIHGPAVPVPDNILLWSRESFDPGECRIWRHHRFLLLLSHAGEAQILVDGRSHIFREGAALLVFPYQSHEFQIASAQIQWTLITFALSNADDIAALRNSCRLFPEELQQECMELSRLSCRLTNSGSSASNSALKLLRDEFRLRLGLFLLHLEKQPVTAASSAIQTESGISGVYILDRIHDYIFRKRNYLVNNEELAKAVGVSVSTLRRSVRSALGFPLSEYLRDLRLTYACELLQNPRLSIGEVATLCGYNSINAFSFAFKHHFGTPPSTRRITDTPGGPEADPVENLPLPPAQFR